jgi:DNA-binding NarL/FixJ family response regulator
VLKIPERGLQSGASTTIPRGVHVLVVESHTLVGAALCDLIRDALDATVETVAGVEAALAVLREAEFDLVVCELSGRSPQAGALASTLSALGRQVPVVLLAAAEEEKLLLDALTSGAAGFFTKDCTPEEFLSGVETVLHGHYAVGRRLLPAVLTRLDAAIKARR